MIADLGTVSFSLALLLQLAYLIAQLRVWQSGTSSLVMLAATLASLGWCGTLILHWSVSARWFVLVPLAEILRNLLWFLLLLSILGLRRAITGKGADNPNRSGMLVLTAATLLIPLLALTALVLASGFFSAAVTFPEMGGKRVTSAFLVIAIAGLALLEQVLRNTRAHHQWHLKFLIMGLGIIFTYDLYLYSNALLFGGLDANLWQIRGAVIAMASPFLLVAVLRTSQQPIQLNISRRLVFHSSVLIAAGVYLLVMSLAGYYIRSISGEWGSTWQILFWVGSLSVMLIVLLSGRVRSRIRLYISRNLFSSKYDYRDEWMRISHTLSDSQTDEPLSIRAIHALANIVDSPAGGLWLTSDGEYYDQVAQLEMGWIENSGLHAGDYLIHRLSESDQLIDLHEEDPDHEELPAWLKNTGRLWLVIPLMLQTKLVGFVVLKESRIDFQLNWEDYDLLKAAGQQTASYIAQMLASDALAEARQFSAFNQVSAFVVHDLKTLNSQLSMLVRNAEKHKHNPEFVEDMISTTSHAVRKMEDLLDNFRNSDRSVRPGQSDVDIVVLIRQLVQAQSKISPKPVLHCELDSLVLSAREAELKSAIGHLIQNAQDATPEEGEVVVVLSADPREIRLLIEDTGKGMSQEFIKTRLFKPFESTKGLTGMGIGVYQSRETIRGLGGDLKVSSEPHKGTRVSITIPRRTTAPS